MPALPVDHPDPRLVWPVFHFTGSQIPLPGDWVVRAACRGCDINLFFGGVGDKHVAIAAREICGRCPVLRQCREYGLRHPLRGTWGGLSERERHLMRKQRRSEEKGAA